MKKLSLVSCAALMILCVIGSIAGLLFAGSMPTRSKPIVNSQPVQPTEAKGVKRSDVAIIFRSLGFDDWQSIDNYRQSTHNGIKVILYDNPVTKASLVVNYDAPDAGHIIHKFLSTTNTDPSAMDWVVAHLENGGQTTINGTEITVIDDPEAGRVIIRLVLP